MGRPQRLFASQIDIRSGDMRPDGSGFFVVVVGKTEDPPAEIQVLVKSSTD